jgi:hypothetical protein
LGTFTLLVALLSGLLALMPGAAHPAAASTTGGAALSTSAAAVPAAPDATTAGSSVAVSPVSGGAASRNRMAIGVSMLPYNDLSVLDSFTASLGGSSHRPAIWSVWSDWLGPNRSFPYELMQGLRDRGVTPMVFWQPDNPTNLNSAGVTYKKIIDGDFDTYIRRWATDAKAWGYPLVLRFAHEADGNWFPWSVGRFGSTPAQFIGAWRHIFNIFRGPSGVGAVNVRFLWSPWSTDKKAAALYPGSHYVDYVGFTGLNWSNEQHPWSSMVNLYREPIKQLGNIAPHKQVIVAEAGSVDKVVHGDSLKPSWIESGYPAVFAAFPRLVAIVYFNVQVPHQADWRLTTPRHALEAYRAISSDSRFHGDLTWDVALPPFVHKPTSSLASTGKAKSPKVNISWVAPQSARGIAYYKLDLRTDDHWKTVADHLAPTTVKAVKVAYGHEYQVRMKATDVRGRTSRVVNTVPFSVTLTDQDAPAIQYSSGFTTAPLAHSSGGTVAWSAHKGSRATITFTGRSFALVSTRGPDRGKAKITIDGKTAGGIKLHAAHVKVGQVVYSANLAEGHHTVTVKVAKNGSAGVQRVDIDAFLVMP